MLTINYIDFQILVFGFDKFANLRQVIIRDIGAINNGDDFFSHRSAFSNNLMQASSFVLPNIDFTVANADKIAFSDAHPVEIRILIE